jgi:hypothetical protein
VVKFSSLESAIVGLTILGLSFLGFKHGSAQAE